MGTDSRPLQVLALELAGDTGLVAAREIASRLLTGPMPPRGFTAFIESVPGLEGEMTVEKFNRMCDAYDIVTRELAELATLNNQPSKEPA